MFELLQELLTSKTPWLSLKKIIYLIIGPDFNDKKNVSTILRNTSNEVSSSLIDSAMSYAFSVSAASLRENYFMKEKLRNVIII